MGAAGAAAGDSQGVEPKPDTTTVDRKPLRHNTTPPKIIRGYPP
jgi:hypothetical protein